ncbi:hypothetical protein [Treponema sp.]|uniref:hypothetical protein n=1 Tax=Treponema sp. TaxID=166 RepID=UPI00298DA147|nr:hypothetical protein [Treponema sp.]MCR5614250.1 hypothetical protein [Treponema sp.]
MSLHTANIMKAFIKIIKSCKGDVVIIDENGNSTEIEPSENTGSIEAVLDRTEDYFELYCTCNQDEGQFFDFLNKYPDAA